MTRLTLLAIVLITIGCSETESPLAVDVAQAPSAPRMPGEYAIPEGIHPNLAAHFADFQPEMTEREYQFLLKQVHDYCYGWTLPFHWRVNRRLSERAAQRVFDPDDGIDLVPTMRLRDKDRIEVAAYFNASIYVRNPGHGQAYYTDANHLIIIEVVQDVHGRGSGSYGRTRDHTSSGDFRRIESIRDYISDKFFAGHGVQVPPIPADLDIALFVVNVDGNLLSTVHEGRGIVYALEDIPRATDAQIELYNQLNSPDAYDCVEFGVDPDDVVIFNQLYIDE